MRLDLRDEGDAEKARALALDTDVVVTNIDRSMLERARLSPADLSDRKSGLIVVEISTFGPGGALSTDGISQAAHTQRTDGYRLSTIMIARPTTLSTIIMPPKPARKAALIAMPAAAHASAIADIQNAVFNPAMMRIIPSLEGVKSTLRERCGRASPSMPTMRVTLRAKRAGLILESPGSIECRTEQTGSRAPGRWSKELASHRS